MPSTTDRLSARGSSPRASLLALVLPALSGVACFHATPALRVNQVGYYPERVKVAVVETESSTPLAWSVVDAKGQAVARGQTELQGSDPVSGQTLHWVDFSEVHQPGRGYRVVVDADTSFPFDIDASIYRRLKYDALRYFYYNRSGIPIALPFALDFKWTRPPGHLSDAEVGCYGEPCPYKLDVTGGWYDAGDHGKYVVNGGISAWTLQNLYERTQQLGTSLGDFADGKLGIPESGNGASDLLDEARFEVEFLLKMQVPEGQERAGMAHHKVHDTTWTMLGLTPATYSESRYLHRPSTAATLNLAATAAQASRLWREQDPAFADRCLLAAKRAWNAAQRFPRDFASAMDNNGGGPYDD